MFKIAFSLQPSSLQTHVQLNLHGYCSKILVFNKKEIDRFSTLPSIKLIQWNIIYAITRREMRIKTQLPFQSKTVKGPLQ